MALSLDSPVLTRLSQRTQTLNTYAALQVHPSLVTERSVAWLQYDIQMISSPLHVVAGAITMPESANTSALAVVFV